MSEDDTTPAPVIDHGDIGHIPIEEEMQASYIDYSMSVIIGRALPDARDGMKPGARRILFAMRDMGLLHNRPYKKSAYVVGEVLGKYHPHGDSSVYDTMVRMAQPFALRYPLVDGQGNFGSLDGDNAAAYRYTEARLTKIAEEMLTDIDKDTVDMSPNYNGEIYEPTVLPARMPNLLLNGSTGIAVGMATNIPPHNLKELCSAVKCLIDNPEADVTELMEHVKGPDFPTGATVCGYNGIHKMYTTGRGHLKVRAVSEIDELPNGKPRIIVTEIPYAVNKATLLETIAKLATNKVVEGITDLRDESNKDGIRIVIELKKGVIPKVVLSNLYKHSNLQTTFGSIMLALDGARPKIMNLKELLECFIRHRFEVITRRTEFNLAKARAREHILSGLLKALDVLDEVVRTIRESKNRDEARAQLIGRFEFSEIQANAILEMRLYQLTGLERDKLQAEYDELVKYISELEDLLANDYKIFALIRDDMDDLITSYDNGRRTAIVPDEAEVAIEDLIADKPAIITVSHTGYIKRVPMDTYREQKRGGKGVSGMGTKDEDYVEHLFVANAHDYILFFMSSGRMYWEKVYEIPEAGRTAKGKALINLLNIREGERVMAMIKVRDFPEDKHVIMATRKGIVKKTKLSLYSRPRRDGIIAINIDEDDQLLGAMISDPSDNVMLTTRTGKSIRFTEELLRSQGRATRGVRGIRVSAGDEVTSMALVQEGANFLVCCENGYGKRTPFDEYRVQGRGGKGIIAIKATERNGAVVGAQTVYDEDALMMITAQGKMIRMAVNDISIIGRSTQGVRLINLDDGDTLVSVTRVAPEEPDEELESDDSTAAGEEKAEAPTEPAEAAEEATDDEEA